MRVLAIGLWRWMKVLMERLRTNATLTSLDLSSNPLKSEGASYIAQVSRSFCTHDATDLREVTREVSPGPSPPPSPPTRACYVYNVLTSFAGMLNRGSQNDTWQTKDILRLTRYTARVMRPFYEDPTSYHRGSLSNTTVYEYPSCPIFKAEHL